MAVTAMHERVLAEHVADRLAQRLAAVDHEQDRLLGVQAAVDEIGEQHRDQRGVLGRAFPQPERNLHALRADPERDDMGAVPVVLNITFGAEGDSWASADGAASPRSDVSTA